MVNAQVFSKVGQRSRSRSQVQNLMFRRKGLVIRYTHAKYERHISYNKLDVFVNHGCPWRQQSRNMAKICKSYILTLPYPQGCVICQ